MTPEDVAIILRLGMSERARREDHRRDVEAARYFRARASYLPVRHRIAGWYIAHPVRTPLSRF